MSSLYSSPAIRPILIFQVLHTLGVAVLMCVKSGDTQLAAVIEGAVPQDTLDLRVKNGKAGGLFALRLTDGAGETDDCSASTS